MTKKHLLKQAFTLTELLIVVIVLGVLAAVAVPKFSRVLETRRTTEAEHVLFSLRTEQEHRCVLGKHYQTNPAAMEGLASAKGSKNYSYTLTEVGANATSSKGYSIQMPSYKQGVLCCEGSYCSSLNKSYPSCSSLSVPEDECAGVSSAPPCENCSCAEYARNHPCQCAPNSCACPAYAAAHPCECANECSCEENPNQEKCRNCSNATYAAAHRCECDAGYAAANPCECQGENTQVCCESKGMIWNAFTQSCTSGTSDEPACSGTKKYIGQVRFATFDEARSQDTCNGDIGFANSAGSGQFNAKNVTEELCNKGSCIDLMTLSCSKTGSSASSEKKKVQKGSAQMSYGSSGTPQGSTCNSRLVAAVADRINNPVKDSSGMGNRILSWQEACPLYCSGMAPVISSTPCAGSCYAEFTHQTSESGKTVTAVEWAYTLSCEIGYEEPSDEDTGSSCLFNKYQWTFTKN